MRNRLQSLLLLVLLAFIPLCTYATPPDNSNFDWMNQDMEELQNNPPNGSRNCLDPPHFSHFHTASASMNLSQAGTWIATGLKVQKDKTLKINWNVANVQPMPRKYRVLYRIDPRFARPQIFIQSYRYQAGTIDSYSYPADSYISDFHHYKSGILLNYQNDAQYNPEQRIIDYNEYFNFVSRPKIQVNNGDVVNIIIDSTNNFFSANSEIQSELGIGNDPILIYTQSPIARNRIVYTDSDVFCSFLVSGASESAAHCNQGKYDGSSYWTLIGVENSALFNSKKDSITVCPNNANGRSNNPLCYYDKGRGMQIRVGSKIIKATETSFIHSNFTGRDLFYYQSDTDGELDFTTGWDIAGMYSSPVSQLMSDWEAALGTYLEYINYVDSNILAYPLNWMYFGSYLMEIEVGRGDAVFTDADFQALGIEYTIIPDGNPIPDSGTSGSNVDEQNFKTNADIDGYVWLKAKNDRPDSIAGFISVALAGYSGSTWVSDLLYNDLVKPLRERFNLITETLYRKLIGDPVLQNIARLLLTIYVIIYGLLYLAGAVKITSLDLVIRVMKIAIIVALFSETSWQFFNDNLFKLFLEGTDYLMNSVISTTSRAGNIFGFMDPILDTYANPDFWALIGISLLQFWNGMFIIAILLIAAILLYMLTAIEVVVSYCLAFLGLAVLISLAPFFILFMLFEQTKDMFRSWLSVMFSYMLQPTIALLFLLIVHQIIEHHLVFAVPKVCWGLLFPWDRLYLDFGPLGTINTRLPFTIGIPFFVPSYEDTANLGDIIMHKPGTVIVVISTTLLIYLLAKFIIGMSDYVTLIVSSLTNTIAPTREGSSGADNPVKDVMKDLGSIAMAPVRFGKYVANKLAAGRRKSDDKDKDKDKEDKDNQDNQDNNNSADSAGSDKNASQK